MSDRRVLNACLACGRQYDVAHLDAGAQVQCECGVSFAVSHKKPHAPRALQCSACGGNLKDGARKCEYCEAEVTLDELRLDSVCPICAARMSSDAGYCMECGTKISPQALTALPPGTHCPRCEGALRSRGLTTDVQVIECTQCAGLWLNEGTFGALCRQADRQDMELRALLPSVKARAIDTSAQSGRFYLPCPFCKELMVRKNYAKISGIIIDQCREHGVWLDHRELEKILAFIREGGLDRSRERDIVQMQERERRAKSSTHTEYVPLGDIGELPRTSSEPSVVDALRWIGGLFFD